MKTACSIYIALCLLAARLSTATDGTWSAAQSGDWSNSANWQNDTVAEGSGATAIFSSGGGTVNNDMIDLTLQDIRFSGNNFILIGNTIALDSAGLVTVLSGNQSINLPLLLTGHTTLSASSNQALTINGNITGSGEMVFDGGQLYLNGAKSFTGPFRHIKGLVAIDNVAALGTADPNPSNLVLGEGTLRYTGSTDTLARGLTMRPGVDTNRASIIDVSDANSTLTISGQVLSEGGNFIKTGAGTLALTHTGLNVIAKQPRASDESGNVVYDSDGIAALNGPSAFLVEQGRLILGAPGQSNVIYTSSGWVGCWSDYSPRLDIVGGITRMTSGYFTIGRGTGTKTSIQSPSMYVSNRAEVHIEGSGLVLANANGKTNYMCRPYLKVDNAMLRVANNIFLSESGIATSTVDVVNGGLFISDQTDLYRGMILSISDGSQTKVTFDNASTNRAYLLRVARGGILTYKGQSVLELDGSPTNALSGVNNMGALYFDNALLKQRTPERSADWFAGLTNLNVMAGGLTIQVDKYAWLDPLIRTGNPAATVTKTGAGVLAVRGAETPITVTKGTLAFPIDQPNLTPWTPGAITLMPGTQIEASGINALGALALNIDKIHLGAPSLVSQPDDWHYGSGAQPLRRDGFLRITPDLGSFAGAAFLLRKQPVAGAWRATFSYRAFSSYSTPADGMAFVIHNDPRGLTAIGGTAQNAGYQYGTPIINSVAVGLIGYYRYLHLGQQGYFTTTNRVLPAITRNSAEHCVKMRYDGAGNLAVEVARLDNGFVHAQTYAVDIAAEVGANEAFVGFTAGTGGSAAQHTITSFTFEPDVTLEKKLITPNTPHKIGGAFVVDAGKSLAINMQPDTRSRGRGLGSLNYGTGAELHLNPGNSDAIPVDNTLPPIDLSDQGLWQLNGNSRWLPDGSLATSTNAVSQGGGFAYTTNKYPVAGSWSARISYLLGQANSTPADYFCLQFQRSGANTTTEGVGFSLMWRYYEGDNRNTQIKKIVNGATTVISDNISPIDLKNGMPAEFIVKYDAPAGTMTVTSTQSGNTNVTVLTDINLEAILGGSEAHLGFMGRTGGSYAENIVTAFEFTPEHLATASAAAPGYLAFDSINGSGPLTVRGDASLGLLGDIDHPTDTLSLKLDNGSVTLGKANLEPLNQNLGPRADWIYSAIGSWAASNTMQFCTSTTDTNGTVTTRRRIRVTDPWHISFAFVWGRGRSNPADAFCMFMHNDPRGSGYSSGNTGNAGFNGMQNSFGIRWYFYPGNQTGDRNSIKLGYNGTFNGPYQSYEPVLFYDHDVVYITVDHDPQSATITATCSNDGISFKTNIFNSVNIQSYVGSEYAWLGFGGGTGGAHAEMRIRDFRMDIANPIDTLPNVNSMALLEVPDGRQGGVNLMTPVTNGTFNIPSVKLGSASKLQVRNSAIMTATLKVASLEVIAGEAIIDNAADAPCAIASASGNGSLAKEGSGILTLTGNATYSGTTRLTSGVLALGAEYLPLATDLHVTSGAQLLLDFNGKQHVHALQVDGVPQPGGAYNATKVPWISGDGTLVVTYPPVGTLLILR